MQTALLRAGLLAASLSLVSVAPAAAFNYDEHCVVSNAALRAALLQRSRIPAADRGLHPLPDTTLNALLRFTEGSPCEERNVGRITFGDWVALGDFASQPIDYFLFVQNDEAWSQFLAGTLPDDVIQRLGASLGQLLYASQNNLDHFGERGMFVFAFWHRAALQEAAAGRIRIALWMEAYALHFLEDHLAPGHVRTPRRGLHSVFALGVHDRYNRLGEIYRPRHVDELTGFLPPPPEDTLLGSRRNSACASIPDVRACLESLERSGLRLHGDGRLDLEPAQRLFMVTLVARSIADVLDALESGRVDAGTNHFAEQSWSSWHVGPEPDSYVYPPTGSIRYGTYEPEEDLHRLVPRNDKIPTLLLGFQGPLHSDQPVTITAGVDLPLFYWPGKGQLANSEGVLSGLPQLLLHAGIDVGFNRRQFSAGPTARIIHPLPQLGTQVSLSGGPRLLRDWDGTALKVAPRFELRGEMGFGLAFFGLGAAWEPYLAQDGHVRRGFTLTSSITPTLAIEFFRN